MQRADGIAIRVGALSTVGTSRPDGLGRAVEGSGAASSESSLPGAWAPGGGRRTYRLPPTPLTLSTCK